MGIDSISSRPRFGNSVEVEVRGVTKRVSDWWFSYQGEGPIGEMLLGGLKVEGEGGGRLRELGPFFFEIEFNLSRGSTRLRSPTHLETSILFLFHQHALRLLCSSAAFVGCHSDLQLPNPTIHLP